MIKSISGQKTVSSVGGGVVGKGLGDVGTGVVGIGAGEGGILQRKNVSLYSASVS